MEYNIYGNFLIENQAFENYSEFLNNSEQFADKGVLFPNAYAFNSAPINPPGSIVTSKSAVNPLCLGNDIACGLYCVRTTFKPLDVITHEEAIFDKLSDLANLKVNQEMNDSIYWPSYNSFLKSDWFRKMFDDRRGMCRLLDLGAGDHFIEIGVSPKDTVYISVHTGSSVIGEEVLLHYRKDGGWLPLGRGYTQDFLKDYTICSYYAERRRKKIAETTVSIMQSIISGVITQAYSCDIPHNTLNYTTEHGWIHRRGVANFSYGGQAIALMWTPLHGIFLGTGRYSADNECLNSYSCSAGRVFSGNQAKKHIKLSDFRQDIIKSGVKTRATKRAIQSSPVAYKNLPKVIDAQKSTVRLQNYLKPLINVKRSK